MITTTPDLPAASTYSLSHGPALQDDPARLTSLAAALHRAAEVSPRLGVRYLTSEGGDTHQTYPELIADACRILGGLRNAGLQPGDKLIFQLQHNPDFVPAFWACVFGGFVPVPISIPPSYEQPNGTLAKLQNAWQMLAAPCVLAGDALVVGLQSFAQRQGLNGFRVIPVTALHDATPAEDWHTPAPDDLALMLLTSGSTGLPKGVQLSHANILARSAATVQFDGFGAHDVSLNWMPLDHVGGLVMFHIRDVYAACAQLQAATDLVLQSPLRWLEWVQNYHVSITWAPNFAFSLINDQADALAGRTFDLSSLRFILNGGEAIVSRTARRFLDLLALHGLPATAMRPAWGMSETSSGVTSSHLFTVATTTDNDPFVEVGGPLPGVSLRIVDRAGQLTPEGVIGSLQIRGLTLTQGYYQNPALNAEVFTADGWFATGDLGVLKEGRLTITGREKDVIIINGVNFHSHELESAAEEVPGVEVSFTAACAIRAAGENTDRIALFFSPAPSHADRLPALIKSIRAAVLKQEGVNPEYVIPVAREAIPKTAIGKIQRAQLKQQFERGDFAELARKYSSSADSSDTPAWFYQPKWLARAATPGQLPAGASFWLFSNGDAAAQALAQALTAAGHPVVHIQAGPAYARTSATAYTLAPGELTHYARLTRDIGSVPDYILHTFTYGQDDAQPLDPAALLAAQATGAHSLLGLLKALSSLGLDSHSVRMLVVSSRTRAVLADDPIAYAKTPLLGFVRTIPQEIAWLDCHHADLAASTPQLYSQRVLSELRGWSEAKETAWRGETRYQAYLGVAAPADTPQELPFVRGGFYLFSGGIGGIGLRFAAHLLQHFDARLLILGRSALPPAEQHAAVLAAGGPAADRIRAVQSLALLGGEFHYAQADVTDAAAVEAAVAAATARWQRPLDGVFHLAGLYHESLLEKETIESLTTVLRPKIVGAWVLNQIARRRPGTLFINFSSLISYFGSLSTGAYAAANNFLDAYSHHQRQAEGLRSYNLLWSSWTDIGMSRGYDAGEALRSRGYLSITAEQGVASLLYALRHEHPQILVGVDGANKTIKRYLDPEATATATATAADEAAYEAPRTEVERQIARIWQEILNVPRVGRTDNFFELGGRSLLAAKMFAQIHKALGKNLPIPALFKAPTLGQLAAIFLEHAKSSAVRINLLTQGKGGTPIFLIPEPGVDGTALAELAKGIDPALPVFGLQIRALAGIVHTGQPVALLDHARLLAEEIAAIAPDGRTLVGGVGFGGLLAWETARALATRGQPPRALVLLSPPPAAFFATAPAPGGDSSGLRLLRPAAESSGGLFGRLFKKAAPAAAGPTKEQRATRERLDDPVLGPCPVPLVVCSAESEPGPWSAAASAGCQQHALTEATARLTALALG